VERPQDAKHFGWRHSQHAQNGLDRGFDQQCGANKWTTRQYIYISSSSSFLSLLQHIIAGFCSACNPRLITQAGEASILCDGNASIGNSFSVSSSQRGCDFLVLDASLAWASVLLYGSLSDSCITVVTSMYAPNFISTWVYDQIR
jgi:hypothetical protein